MLFASSSNPQVSVTLFKAQKPASSGSGVAIPIYSPDELSAPRRSLPQIHPERPPASRACSNSVRETANPKDEDSHDLFAHSEAGPGTRVSFQGYHVKKKSLSVSENFSFADDSPKRGYEYY